MSGQQDGIHVSRRLVFIMITVSLFVNVFFLLMGILIGKDDLKWQSQESEPVAQERAEVIAEDPDPRSALEEDLSAFEETEVTRTPPMDRDLIEKKASREQAQKDEAAEAARREEEQRAREERDREAARQEQERQARLEQERQRAEASKPAPRPKNSAASDKETPGFYVQVLAISDAAKARDFRDKIRDKGFKAVMVTEGAFHKVRVGPYNSRTDAERIKDAVNAAFKVKGWVVKK